MGWQVMPGSGRSRWFQILGEPMAIQTVTSANLSEYVASRTAKGADIQTGEQLAEAVQKVEGVATPGNPVIKAGVTETNVTAPDPGNPTPTASTKAKNPKEVAQDRIDEQHRLRKEAEEFAEEEYNARLRAERRIGELESQLSSNVKPAPVAPAEEELKRPSVKDFTDQDAYETAMTEYEAKRDERVAAKAAESARQSAALAQQNELLAQRIAAAKKDLPDFDEVIQSADRRTRGDIPNHIKAAIVESDLGAFIAYHLAKDPKEEARIFKLSPAKALLELGKIEQTYAKPVTANGNADPKPIIETTRAPAPVGTVRGEGGGIVNSDLTKPMPFAEYKAQRIEEIRKKRRH